MSIFDWRVVTDRLLYKRDIDGPNVGPWTLAHRRPDVTDTGLFKVSRTNALQHDAVWACRRLRADLVSTFPVDTYTRVSGFGTKGKKVQIATPSIIKNPGGEDMDYLDWMWTSQWNLDGCGNQIGVITAFNGWGKPLSIELVEPSRVSVHVEKGTWYYRIDGKRYERESIYHERQYPIPGTPLGLDPLGFAAWHVSEYMSMQQFALDWFGGGGIPKARLKQLQKKVNDKEARVVADRYKATIQNGDIFVHGMDWDFDLVGAEQAGMEFLEGRKLNIPAICRYFGAPPDLIHAAVAAAGSIRYANITQKHLQWLILELGPTVTRRENRLSRLLAENQYVKINTDALLRMDPKERAEYMAAMIEARLMTNTECREKLDLEPLTAAQIKEFEKIYGGGAAAKPAVPAKPKPEDPAEEPDDDDEDNPDQEDQQ